MRDEDERNREDGNQPRAALGAARGRGVHDVREVVRLNEREHRGEHARKGLELADGAATGGDQAQSSGWKMPTLGAASGSVAMPETSGVTGVTGVTGDARGFG